MADRKKRARSVASPVLERLRQEERWANHPASVGAAFSRDWLAGYASGIRVAAALVRDEARNPARAPLAPKKPKTGAPRG